MKKIIKNVSLALTFVMFKVFAFATEHIDRPEGPISYHPKQVHVEILKYIGSDDIKNVISVNKMFHSALQENELWYIYCRNAKFISLTASFDPNQDYDAQYKFFAKPSFTLFQTEQTNNLVICGISADARTLVAQFYKPSLNKNEKLSITNLRHSEVCVANCPYNENYLHAMIQNHVLHLMRFSPIVDNQSIIQNETVFQYVNITEDGLIITGQLLNYDRSSLEQPCTLTKDNKSGNYDLEYLDQSDFDEIKNSIMSDEFIMKIMVENINRLLTLDFTPRFIDRDCEVVSGHINFYEGKQPYIYIKNLVDCTLKFYCEQYHILRSNIEIKNIDAMTSNGVVVVGCAFDRIRNQNFIYRAAIPTDRNKF